MGNKRTLQQKDKKPSPVEEQQLEELKGLLEKHKQLAQENGRLVLRHDILLGMCLASAQAVSFLSGVTTGSVACDELGLQLEELVAGCPELASYFATKTLSPAASIPGSASLLLAHFLHNDRLATGGLHASLLDGQPMSLLTCALTCVCSDPQLARTVVTYKDRGEVQSVLTTVQRDLDPLLPQYETVAGHQKPVILRQMAVIIMTAVNLYVGTTIVKPGVIYGQKSAQANLPPEAALDHITAQVGLEPAQLARILDGLQLFQQFLAPLAKQKADISARMARLLQQQNSDSSELQLQQSWPGQSASPASSAVSAPAAAGAARGGTPGAASLPAAGATAVAGIEGKMALLGLSSHETLSSLTEQLARVSARTTWLDHCSFWYALGQLSWLQFARLIVSFKPFLPLPGLWIRRLVCQTSLFWPRGLTKAVPNSTTSSCLPPPSAGATAAVGVQLAATRPPKVPRRSRAKSKSISLSTTPLRAAAQPSEKVGKARALSLAPAQAPLGKKARGGGACSSPGQTAGAAAAGVGAAGAAAGVRGSGSGREEARHGAAYGMSLQAEGPAAAAAGALGLQSGRLGAQAGDVYRLPLQAGEAAAGKAVQPATAAVGAWELGSSRGGWQAGGLCSSSEQASRGAGMGGGLVPWEEGAWRVGSITGEVGGAHSLPVQASQAASGAAVMGGGPAAAGDGSYLDLQGSGPMQAAGAASGRGVLWPNLGSGAAEESLLAAAAIATSTAAAATAASAAAVARTAASAAAVARTAAAFEAMVGRASAVPVFEVATGATIAAHQRSCMGLTNATGAWEQEGSLQAHEEKAASMAGGGVHGLVREVAGVGTAAAGSAGVVVTASQAQQWQIATGEPAAMPWGPLHSGTVHNLVQQTVEVQHQQNGAPHGLLQQRDSAVGKGPSDALSILIQQGQRLGRFQQQQQQKVLVQVNTPVEQHFIQGHEEGPKQQLYRGQQEGMGKALQGVPTTPEHLQQQQELLRTGSSPLKQSQQTLPEEQLQQPQPHLEQPLEQQQQQQIACSEAVALFDDEADDLLEGLGLELLDDSMLSMYPAELAASGGSSSVFTELLTGWPTEQDLW